MSGDVIEQYLTELATQLPGPARARAHIVAEIGDGLDDAVSDRMTHGVSRSDAAQAAISEFGDPRVVAAACTPVLATAQVHRYGIRFILTGPVVGGLWVTTLVLSTDFLWTTQVAIVMLAAALVAAMPCALFSVVATGRGSRWIVASPRTATIAATITATGAMTIDFALLVLLVIHMAIAPDSLVLVPALLAATASGLRLACASVGARRLRATRTTLN